MASLQPIFAAEQDLVSILKTKWGGDEFQCQKDQLEGLRPRLDPQNLWEKGRSEEITSPD